MVSCAFGARAFGGILCILCSEWSLRWLDVGICTDASEKGVTVAVRAGCRELASEVGRGSERTGFQRSSRSIRAKSRALRSTAPEAGLEFSSWDEEVMSLARRKSRADFPEVSLPHLGPSEWKKVAYGGFSREENIIILEARSILYAAQYAENNYPPGRLLILSDNLALVLALCETLETFDVVFSHASDLCVWFQGKFCLIIQVDTVRAE